MNTLYENDRARLVTRSLTRGLTAAAVCVLVLGLYRGVGAQTGGAPSGNAQNGKTLYASNNCAQCHGASAEGTAAAPSLAASQVAFAAFLGQLRNPADIMPAFPASQVSDAQAADIYAFMRSLRGAAPAPSANAAGGNLENGKRIYVAYGCYECHGYAGHGGAGPKLGPNPIPLADMIKELRQPNQMPPYTEKVVTDAEIADIRAFLASLPQPPNPDSIPLLRK
jgi:mono/diheme cytochrome c family protein